MQVGKNKEGMNEWSCGSIRCVHVIVRKEMRIDGNKASRLHPRETYSHYSRSKACFHRTKWRSSSRTMYLFRGIRETVV